MIPALDGASRPALHAVSSTLAPAVVTVDDTVEIPKPLDALGPEERKVWKYLTEALRDAGLIHRTDAVLLMVITRTYRNWINLEAELERYRDTNGGETTKYTDKGYPIVHPLFYAAAEERKALLQWLPEALLTIASYQKVKRNLVDPNQPSLFGADPLGAFVGAKPRVG